MKTFLELDTKEKLQIFEQIRSKTGLPIQAIEKDWWVVQTLSLIFSMDCAPHIVFKGGTSLSKAWNAIERFSEDIDLALDRRFLGFETESSKTQVAKLRKASFEYISTVFFHQLQEQFNNAGFTDLKIQLATVKDTDQDPIIIEIYYPEVSPTSVYLKPKDYEIMQQNMIYGNSLSFEKLMQRIELLQKQINMKK